MNGFFEQTVFLRTEDTDAHGEWRASGIFLAMQEAGGAHCEGYNLGMRAMRAQNLAWVVNRARVRMDRLPRLGETVTVRTWPKPPQHFFFPRYYEFRVGEERVGAASTLYVQLDLTARRMAKPWLGGNDELTCALDPSLPLPGSIPALDAPEATALRTARYSDLDINGHVNNARYLDWFCDSLPWEHYSAWRLSEVLIHYNHEIRPEEQVTLSLRQAEGQSVLHGALEGTPCFAVGATWARREG